MTETNTAFATQECPSCGHRSSRGTPACGRCGAILPAAAAGQPVTVSGAHPRSIADERLDQTVNRALLRPVSSSDDAVAAPTPDATPVSATAARESLDGVLARFGMTNFRVECLVDGHPALIAMNQSQVLLAVADNAQTVRSAPYRDTFIEGAGVERVVQIGVSRIVVNFASQYDVDRFQRVLDVRQDMATVSTNGYTPPRSGSPVGSRTPSSQLARRSAQRGLDATCYVITGIVLFVAAAKAPGHAAGAVVLGLGCLGYGAYIALTRGSYWVTTITYAVPLLAVLFVLFA